MKRTDFIRLAVTAPWWLRQVVAGGGTGFIPPDPRPAAVAWLLRRQSADGAWRSDTYGAFRDGRALTPVVLRSLAREDGTQDAAANACSWLLENRDSLIEHYPVHLSSALLECAAAFPVLEPLVPAALAKLLSLQCPRSGGWSYATIPPPASGPLPPMQQPNLAATVMALDGLAAAGCPAGDRSFARALPFLHTCQNFGTGEFDDGGFFQMPGDPSRNKAGSAGTDRHGETRHLSYASATSDGLRGLRRCGGDHPSPRVNAARKWLDDFPDKVPADLKYYTARSLAKSGLLYPALRHALTGEQSPDGSWRNPAGEMREDCPLVSTALMVEALSG